MMTDWFKYWFNSHHYFLLYQNRDEQEAKLFFDLIRRNIPIQSDWKILDFCCGYGRLSKVIVKEGYSVTGLDLSENFIKHALEESKKENLQIEFVQCDARNFNEIEKYNLGISFFTSFGYFSDEENDLTFKNLAKSITKSGWIVFDYFNPEFVLKNLNEKESFEVNGFKIDIVKRIEDKRIIKHIKINSIERSEEYLESVRIYTLEELNVFFNKNGLEVEKIFGDYLGNELNGNSPRIIIFAQKL
jgi:SAM-dependent methyltransferase